MYSALEDPPPQPGKKSTLKLDMFLHCNFNILRILGKNRHGLNKNNLENLTKNKQKQKNKNKPVNDICMT